MRSKFVMLVYQAGIANVFSVKSLNVANENRNAKRLFQGSFHSAEMFAAGMGAAGKCVRSVHCNRAGDIINEHWSEDIESAPFYDKMNTQHWN